MVKVMGGRVNGHLTDKAKPGVPLVKSHPAFAANPALPGPVAVLLCKPLS
jgi:hypothetical protein